MVKVDPEASTDTRRFRGMNNLAKESDVRVIVEDTALNIVICKVCSFKIQDGCLYLLDKASNVRAVFYRWVGYSILDGEKA